MDKYGIIGYPLKHSFSPQIHNAAFEKLGINAHYSKIEIRPDIFDDEIIKLKKSEIKGFNITIPFKQKIMSHLDEIDELAKKAGAVNTVKSIKKKWIGYNTDVYGFLTPLKFLKTDIKNILVIGAGGAAKAVCYALIHHYDKIKLRILNRTEINTIKLINNINENINSVDVKEITRDDLKNLNYKFNLIVNTTSIGMGALEDRIPLEIQNITYDNAIIYDLIYNPLETLLLKKAHELHLKAINGLPMLMGQARESFKIWTGQNYPDELRLNI